MQLSKRGGLVVGLRRPGEEEQINPPKEHEVNSETQLLYLAQESLLDPPP